MVRDKNLDAKLMLNVLHCLSSSSNDDPGQVTFNGYGCRYSRALPSLAYFTTFCFFDEDDLRVSVSGAHSVTVLLPLLESILLPFLLFNSQHH